MSDVAQRRKQLPLLVEIALLLVVALLLSIGLKAFVAQAFYIPSGSMRETLVESDRILVEKPSYWLGSPRRGDIVVFSDPGGWLRAEDGRRSTGFARVLEEIGLRPAGGHLVKRVIGVAGDHVVCCDAQGRITVNDVPLDESSYLAPGAQPSEVTFDKTVPDGFLWVMGDNRAHSADSRAHLGDPGGGFVPVGDVVGKVVMVVWPFGHLETLHRPDTLESLG